MNKVGTLGKSVKHDESDFIEEKNYLDREILGFWSKGQRSNQDTLNLRQENQYWSYYGDMYRDKSRENVGDLKRKDDYKEKSVLHVQLMNYDTDSRMELFLVRLAKGLESRESCLKVIKAVFLKLR